MLKAYTALQARLNSVRTEEEGATATEYALIIGVASIAIVGALFLLAPAITDFVEPRRHPRARHSRRSRRSLIRAQWQGPGRLSRRSGLARF